MTTFRDRYNEAKDVAGEILNHMVQEAQKVGLREDFAVAVTIEFGSGPADVYTGASGLQNEADLMGKLCKVVTSFARSRRTGSQSSHIALGYAHYTKYDYFVTYGIVGGTTEQRRIASEAILQLLRTESE
jgi:hypothetical protein